MIHDRIKLYDFGIYELVVVLIQLHRLPCLAHGKVHQSLLFVLIHLDAYLYLAMKIVRVYSMISEAIDRFNVSNHMPQIFGKLIIIVNINSKICFIN